jgi:transcriptional regulator with XRE-family HTH domain
MSRTKATPARPRATVAQRFGKALRAARTDAQVSQHAVAEDTGVSRPSIARYEAGDACPDLDAALMLSKRLGFSLDDLAE